MLNRIFYTDMDRHNVWFQMRSLVSRFFPASWMPNLNSSMVFTLYSFLVNKPFGGVMEEIGILFEGKICKCAETCTFVNIRGKKGLLVADAVEHVFYEWPEWGLGVYAEVCRYLTKYVTPTRDPVKDYLAAPWEGLLNALIAESRGHRVFEALGILGGCWIPAEGVYPTEKALDNLN